MGNICSGQSSYDQVLIQALTQVCGCFFGDENYIHMMKPNLEDLEKTTSQLKERRDDLLARVSIAEDKGLKRLAEVQGWVLRVQDIESEVRQLLETKSTETKRLCLFGYCSDNCISSCEYGKKVSSKLEEVQELFSEGTFEDVAIQAPVPKVGKQDIQTTGLDLMVTKAWNSLLNPEQPTLGIYGMGGVGKTTLLARINNKFLEEVNESDVVIWVVVSKKLQIEEIQNKILRRLRPDKEWTEETEEEKASSIYDILSRKKFVLLLDDLWSEVDLNKIRVPPPTRDNGSKIVFTTRSREVCRAMKPYYEMKVDCLSTDEAWKLFQITVGETTLECHDDIPRLAEEVAKKCGGLPLALTVIGKAMACKEDVHDWHHALNLLNSSSHGFLISSSHGFPDMEEKILPLLKFSYDDLRGRNFKSCFLYCSLFPEDYEIKKKKLIEYWIGEGFINGNREEDGSSSQGHVIINSLLRVHLLMNGESRETVKMHDVLREMALWIASDLVKSDGQLNFVQSGGQLRNIPDDIEWEVVRRISLMRNQIEKISCFPNCPNLSTLFLRDNSLTDISGEFFRFMSALVVLDLSSNHRLEILPREFFSLSSMKYLNLSYTGIRWLRLEGLNKLISLNLEKTFYLISIHGIGTSLPNLQVLKLYFSRVCIDARLMEELQLLQHLKILTANIEDTLILERFQGVKCLASNIRKLSLQDISEAVVVLNTAALCGLQRLDIVQCKFSEIKIDCERSNEREERQYTNSPGFKHLSKIYIYDLQGPKDLTWLLFVQKLRDLCVEYSHSIEEIINREKAMSIRNMHPSIDVPFAKVEYLRLRVFSKLKRICSSPPALPNLKEFSVEHCPKLPQAATEFPRQEQE